MKTAVLLALVFLAGAASCNQVQYSRPDWLPDWIPSAPEEWGIDIGALLPAEKPDWWPEVDWATVTLPELLEIAIELRPVLPRIWEYIQNVLAQFGITGVELPSWWPPTLPEIPELPDVPVAEIINGLNIPVPGVPARIQNHPSAVQIEYGFESVWIQTCSGALVTNYHILSSARCLTAFHLDVKFLRARVGATNRYEYGSVHDIGSVVVHPNYGDIEENFLEADIALGRLFAAVVFSDFVNAVPIVVPDYFLTDDYPLILCGWGKTAEGATGISNRELHDIELVAINKAACVDKWSQLRILADRVKISGNSFCAGRVETNGRDASIRDVGAPFYSHDDILVGILSFGHYLGDQSYPLVATYIAPYTPWIEANAV